MGIQQIIFVIVLIIVASMAVKLYRPIFRNISLGRSWNPETTSMQRWRQMLLVAFGQKKMFKRWIPAVLHLGIYVAFLFTQIELIEIIIDGVFGVHRFFVTHLGQLYTIIISTIEFLSLFALIATIAFLWRRNIKRVDRFTKKEMKGWPTRDANLILLGEIVLIIGILTMNGTDVVLQSEAPQHYAATGFLMISGWLGPAIFGGLDTDVLMGLERVGWWLHILTVFAFLLYLPFSKHLHILFAFPNTYFAKQQPTGKMENMPSVMQEVQNMLNPPQGSQPAEEEIPEFGARDVFNLTWKNLMDAYTCTECGRCTAECPANITGKKLSPRKIMMDVRDRLEEVGKKLDSKNPAFITATEKDSPEGLSPKNFDDGRSLFDLISREEIHACTTCQACIEACPVLIDPLDIILQMRRYEILTEGSGPADWLPMFNSLENSGAVWQVNVDRTHWTKDLESAKDLDEV